MLFSSTLLFQRYYTEYSDPFANMASLMAQTTHQCKVSDQLLVVILSVMCMCSYHCNS